MDFMPKPLVATLKKRPRRWAITGVAGFIGSHLLEALLRHDQHVSGLDNLAAGSEANLEEVRRGVTSERWDRFRFYRGDIRDEGDCRKVCTDVDIVLHHAATVSVPLSIEQPHETMEINVGGFVNMMKAVRDLGVKRCVYASSSAVYGDDPHLPKVEDQIGRPLSPYAQSKLENEESAELFAHLFKTEVVGLRYFNVFGPRQNPNGPYAGVIPQWITAMMRGKQIYINGDGSTTRDFCHVDNVVQANLCAGIVDQPKALAQVYNIAVGTSTTLNELFLAIQNALASDIPEVRSVVPRYRDFRPGDIRHSHADISKAARLLNYEPHRMVVDGIAGTVRWYREIPR